MRISWTAGALRAFERARESSASRNHDTIEPTDLLWALWCEETRAAEILGQWAIEKQQIRDICGIETECVPSLEDARGDFPPPSSDLLAVRQAASELLAKVGGSTEIGTEFLLWGLFEVDSTVSTALRDWGITAAELTKSICRSSGITTEPIAVDFELESASVEESEPTPLITKETDDGIERLLDAAANRAREGLRVVEDAVRFLFNDRSLTERLKAWRHDLRTACGELDSDRMLASRNTTGDVGTTVQTTAEFHRQSVRDIVTANFKRTQEALRSLEEFGKLRSAKLGHQFEQLRYRLYTLEKDVLQTVPLTSGSVPNRLRDRHLYVLLTEAACQPHSWEEVIEALSQSDLARQTIVQIREKSMSDRDLLDYARRVRQLTQERDMLLIMNDRPDLAVLCDADGVHVGQEELSVQETRRILGPNRLVGVSTHTIEQARIAVNDGADYIGVGPVFTSKTKSFSAFAGLEFVRQVTAEINIPWYPIGGIGLDNIGAVIEAGARSVAVCNGICGVNDPAETATQILHQLTQTESE
ncbi:thiamine phosphate synthase [Thalassoroseus pseudoceratinae]|uniref:thiamine phosphate synthase n=1 Tax=Thalassoroseus pseudoceratinae TaxID=2713176 RepID=UPI001981D05E|nr:thiamine phosphate synthase [Thalassoroseus pseudoceratinae]